MPLTSADCKAIGKMMNHATGRCITKKTDKRLRHKQGDYSPCPSGLVRSAANRCVNVKSEVSALKKRAVNIKKETVKVDKAIKKNAAALEKVQKKLKKLAKK